MTGETTRAERVHTVAAACLGWLFSAMDIVLLLLLREDIERDLGVAAASLDAAIGVGLVFSALGAMVFAQLGDRFGRARALTLAIVIYSVGTGAMALSWDAWSLVAFRAVSGIGTGGEWSLGFALIGEVWRPVRRGTIGGLVQSMFNVGTLLGIVLAVSLGDRWRLVFGLAAAPAFVVVYIRSKVPESAIWRQLEEARTRGEVPADLARAFGRPPLGEIFRGRLLRVTLLATLLFTLMNCAFYMFGSQVTSFLTSPLAEGGMGWTRGQAGPIFFSMTFMAGLSAALAGHLSDLVGRRTVFSALCCLGACAFVALFFVLRGLEPDRPLAFWVVIVVVSAAYGINGVVGAYFTELYPTHLRATGPGFVSNLGKLLSGGAPLLAGLIIRSVASSGGSPRSGWALGLSAPALCYAVLAALVWTLPSVDGRSLAALERDEYLETRRRSTGR
jgi:MFS family permease